MNSQANSATAPVVPTSDQILAAGYPESAVEPIIQRQQELLGQWLIDHPPNPETPAVPVALPVVSFTRGGNFLYGVCPACQASIAADVSSAGGTVTHSCGQQMTVQVA
jgi:hypothetical protein